MADPVKWRLRHLEDNYGWDSRWILVQTSLHKELTRLLWASKLLTANCSLSLLTAQFCCSANSESLDGAASAAAGCLETGVQCSIQKAPPPAPSFPASSSSHPRFSSFHFFITFISSSSTLYFPETSFHHVSHHGPSRPSGHGAYGCPRRGSREAAPADLGRSRGPFGRDRLGLWLCVMGGRSPLQILAMRRNLN